MRHLRLVMMRLVMNLRASWEFPDCVDSKLAFLIPVALGRAEKKEALWRIHPISQHLEKDAEHVTSKLVTVTAWQGDIRRRISGDVLMAGGLGLSPKLRSTGVRGSYRRGNSSS